MSPQTRTPPPRFGLLDAMVLVAATGVGLAIIRATHLDGRFDGLVNTLQTGNLRQRVIAVAEGANTLSPILAMWSLAVVALMLRQGRRRRRARQPGFAVGVVAALGTAAAFYVLAFDNWGASGHDGWIDLAAWLTGFAVLASWTTLALAGVWRPRPHWLDRLGQLLGVFWIGLFLGTLTLIALE